LDESLKRVKPDIAVITTKSLIASIYPVLEVFYPGEKDVNEWFIEGEPNMRLLMENPATVEMTCACAINRLPDVIAAQPGYVTSEKLPDLKFRRQF
jgi:4-hydroxy-tetrahydrodipicolinate reductase